MSHIVLIHLLKISGWRAMGIRVRSCLFGRKSDCQNVFSLKEANFESLALPIQKTLTTSQTFEMFLKEKLCFNLDHGRGDNEGLSI
jgi:hypothetical protein